MMNEFKRTGLKSFRGLIVNSPYGGRGDYVVRADCMMQRAVNIGEITYLMNIDSSVINGLERLRN